MTARNDIEQLRAEFEANERTRHGYGIDTLTRYMPNPDEYALPLTQARWEGYQAGRTALQSQDREDKNSDVDAAMEAVRKQFCALPKYSFVMRKGGVSRVHDGTGNWIEFDQAHALFDPVNVDHARRIEEGT